MSINFFFILRSKAVALPIWTLNTLEHMMKNM